MLSRIFHNTVCGWCVVWTTLQRFFSYTLKADVLWLGSLLLSLKVSASQV